jgi:Holliday junction resolvase RusA-like endonuclease
MTLKEKGRREGDPIPNAVRQDNSKFSTITPSSASVSSHARPSRVRGDDVSTEPITISLQGPPQGKGRARAFLLGGHIGHYTPEKTRTYEGMIRTAAMDAVADRPPFDEPVEFVLRAVFPVPASWSERKRRAAIVGDIKPGKKPDLDNIAKAWNDALNGVAYRDDCLICRMTLEKRYGPQPLVVVTVKAVQA